jgi:hypothetical protein
MSVFVVVVLNVFFIPLVYFCYPETKGITLEQIDHICLGKGKGFSALTQGVRESIHAKHVQKTYREQTSDEEVPNLTEQPKDDSHSHIEQKQVC